MNLKLAGKSGGQRLTDELDELKLAGESADR